MKRKSLIGFTLIELMIVVAIIAILAAIALPQYRDFLTRSKVSELLVAAGACKVSVMEYRAAQNEWPPNQDASGCESQDTKYVSSLVVEADGSITVTAKTGPNAIDDAAAGNLVLAPKVSVGGQVDWACNGPGTTIPKKFLPAPCR